jgi:hypothetical protein
MAVRTYAAASRAVPVSTILLMLFIPQPEYMVWRGRKNTATSINDSRSVKGQPCRLHGVLRNLHELSSVVVINLHLPVFADQVLP